MRALRCLKKYVLTDIDRWFRSYTWCIGVIGVMASLFFSLDRRGLIEDVVLTYGFSTSMTGALLSYVFCAFSFATVYIEDIEHKYIRYSTIRGSLKSYVFSKTVVIYLSSIVIMFIGTLMFLLLCRTQLPWAAYNPYDQNSYGVELAGCYAMFFKKKWYLLYCLLCSLHMGVIAGALSNIASMCSVFISNRALVLAIPILIFRIFTSVGFGPSGFCNIYALYADYKFFKQDMFDLLFVVLLTAILSLISAFGSYFGLKEKL